ncbi:uncharacterized protein LOC116608993 [Nematostella vectensis]|uniref:uncharacterized protein LOC116608993 n=1 Tax=Nematostella vectensis TaxID=45351 RepID=UPI002076DF82|nr:uncharacterized protein LOC116608993 [Nematostella vectensis]
MMSDRHDNKAKSLFSDSLPKSLDSNDEISTWFSDVDTMCEASSTTLSGSGFEFPECKMSTADITSVDDVGYVDKDNDSDNGDIDQVLPSSFPEKLSKNDDKQKTDKVKESLALGVLSCDSTLSPLNPEQAVEPGIANNQKYAIATYNLDGRLIVTLPDIYKVLRESCGTCSALRGLINKLAIVTSRFQPLHMTRMKHLGAVSLEAKCCSFMSVADFKRILEKYKEENLISNPESIVFLPHVNVNVPSVSVGSLGEDKFLDDALPLPNSSPVAMATDDLHTFTIKDQVVVCTVELQKIFEALFGQSVSMSLVKLGVIQKKFTPLQLDQVMDFVDVDESDVQSASFYISKKDAERVFQYAEALAGVEIMVRWMEPLKLSEDNSLHEFHQQIMERATTLERTTNSEEKHKINVPVDDDDDDDDVFGRSDKDDDNDGDGDGDCDVDGIEESEVEPGSTSSITGSSKYPPVSPNPAKPSNILFEGPSSSTVFKSLSPTDQMSNSPSQSSPGSSVSDLSCSSDPNVIRTYVIEGQEVVCIPDIHKIVIHLYGQSVQVGYYLQRLQIFTQRFSTMQVKRLKALNALNSKATLCTYITKSDAIRLLKMYDVFNTDSRLQLIQWADAVGLEGYESNALPSREEAVAPPDPATPPQEENIEPVKISTFLINGEVVVSVPDAHKVVQVLNGQSVQVRYNMDKLGIVKRKYSYSQVYQLRAISDLKRPSMCTFITKADADKLLMHYLTPENASRLGYIEWLPPLKLNDLNVPEPSTGNPHEDQLKSDGGAKCAENISSDQQESMALHTKPKSLSSSDLPTMVVTHSATRDSVTVSTPILANVSKVGTGTHNKPKSCETGESMTAMSPGIHMPMDTRRVNSSSHGSQITPTLITQGCRNIGTEDQDSPRGQKRASDDDLADPERKRLKAEKDEIAATLQRKETEMKILHDAYQQQVAHERQERRKVEQESAELRASNEELLKNLQRKESEMKILHDSYQYQIRKERETREALESEITELKGSAAFASGVCYTSNIKQEKP